MKIQINNVLDGFSGFIIHVNQNWPQYFIGIEKGFLVILSLLYIIFAILIVRQVNMMSRSVTGKVTAVLIVLANVNLIFTLFLAFLTFFFL